jgi:protoheme IX farnesyltransferase
MKAETLGNRLASKGAVRSLIADYLELVKFRLTMLVLLSTLAGFYMGMNGDMSWDYAFHVLLGTGLVAAGSAALNQLMEIEWDGKMKRTQNRPLPAGRLHPNEALIFGFVTSIVGLAYLLWFVNLISAVLAALTLAVYVYLYTPSKRITTLNTIIGAVPGALPPLIGWAAARGDQIGVRGFLLFFILFFWQLPHFLAIAWMYRDDYERAGFQMLPVLDSLGHFTGRQAVIYAASLLPISLMPVILNMAGWIYGFSALTLGILFFGLALKFWRVPSRAHARNLFLGSIFYLPLLLMTMCLDKL